MTFHVEKTSAPPLIANSDAAWFKEEPNDVSYSPTDLGTLPVNDDGPHYVDHNAFITERPGRIDGPRPLWLTAQDIDRYRVAFDDFVDVSFAGTYGPIAPLTVGQNVQLNYGAGEAPPCERDVLGPRRADFAVTSSTGQQGIQLYNVRISYKRRHVPGDWGERLEGGPEGAASPCTPAASPGPVPGHRPLDLESTANTNAGSSSARSPYAWQHVAGDVDRYAIRFPPTAGPPRNHTPCEYDQEGHVTVTAYGMRLDAEGQTALDSLRVERSTLVGIADRTLRVAVTHPAGKRDAYSLAASWKNGVYHDKKTCEFLRSSEEVARRLRTLRASSRIPMHPSTPIEIGPQVNPEPFAARFTAQGAYQSIHVSGGGVDTIVAGRPDQRLGARLYDTNGVLVAESTPIDAAPPGTPTVAGLTAQSRLRAPRLRNGEYVLQLIPGLGTEAFAPPPAAATVAPVALSPAR